jgi:hypothetical protein
MQTTYHHQDTFLDSALRPPAAARTFPRSLLLRERKDATPPAYSLGFLGILPKAKVVRTDLSGCATSAVHRVQHVCSSYQLSPLFRTGRIPRPNISQVIAEPIFSSLPC